MSYADKCFNQNITFYTVIILVGLSVRSTSTVETNAIAIKQLKN